MKSKRAYFCICSLLIISTLGLSKNINAATENRQEAETAKLSGGAIVSNNNAASGGKIVGNLSKDATARLRVWADTVSSCTLKIQYISGENRGARLFVNDILFKDLYFNSTGSWEKTGILNVNNVSLKKGWNSIDLKGGSIHSTYAPDIDVVTALISQGNINPPISAYNKEGANIKLNIPDSYFTQITPQNLTRWINHLDAAYNSYYDLVGLKPRNGQKINVEVSTGNGGWAWVLGSSTSTIYWQTNYIKDELKKCNDNDDWSFGILHEMGHLYDLDGRWEFDAEFWANTKMYFILEALNGKVYQNKYINGSQLAEYYRKDAGGSYEKTLKNGTYSGDGLTYLFIKIKNNIGIESFKKTFRYFNSLPISSVPTNEINKFNLFMTKLRDYSGKDVLSMLSSVEKKAIGMKYGGTVSYK